MPTGDANANAGAGAAGAAGGGAAGGAAGAGAGGAAAGDAAKLGAGAGAGGAAGLGAGAGGDAAKDKGAAGGAGAAAGGEAAKPLELKLPEGFDPKDPAIGRIKGVAEKAKLTPEQAQAVADDFLTGPELKTLREVEKLTRDYQAELQGRVEALRADPEIGGAKLDASLKVANGALQRFAGSPEALGRLNKLFEAKGISNDPDVVRLFVNAGKATSEDSMAGTSGGSHGDKPPTNLKELAAKLYG